MQKDSIETLHQNRNHLVQEAGLSSLARVYYYYYSEKIRLSVTQKSNRKQNYTKGTTVLNLFLV